MSYCTGPDGDEELNRNLEQKFAQHAIMLVRTVSAVYCTLIQNVKTRGVTNACQNNHLYLWI